MFTLLQLKLRFPKLNMPREMFSHISKLSTHIISSKSNTSLTRSSQEPSFPQGKEGAPVFLFAQADRNALLTTNQENVPSSMNICVPFTTSKSQWSSVHEGSKVFRFVQLKEIALSSTSKVFHFGREEQSSLTWHERSGFSS